MLVRPYEEQLRSQKEGDIVADGGISTVALRYTQSDRTMGGLSVDRHSTLGWENSGELGFVAVAPVSVAMPF